MQDFIVMGPNGPKGGCFISSETGNEIANNEGYPIDGDSSTQEEVEASIKEMGEHFKEELRKTGEMSELLKKKEDIDMKLDSNTEDTDDFFDDSDDFFTNDDDNGKIKSSGRNDAVCGIDSEKLDAAHIDHKPDFEDAPYLKAVGRNQMKMVLEKALMHGSEKPILVLTLHKESFYNTEGDNFLEIMNYLLGPGGYEKISPLQEIRYLELWPVRSLLVHIPGKYSYQPDCDQMCYALELANKCKKQIIVNLYVDSESTADAIAERWSNLFDCYAYCWTRESLASWAKDKNLNPVLIDFFENADYDPTGGNSAVLHPMGWQKISDAMNKSSNDTVENLEAYCEHIRKNHCDGGFHLLSMEEVVKYWKNKKA